MPKSVLEELKKNRLREEDRFHPPLPAKIDHAKQLDANTYVLGDGSTEVMKVYQPSHLQGQAAAAGKLSGGKKNPLAFLIQHVSGRGEELVAHAFKVLRGELTVKQWLQAEGGPIEVERAPSIEEQQKARDYLTNRGWGKEAQLIEVNFGEKEEEYDLSVLTTDELATFLALKRKMRRGANPIDVTPRAREVVEAEIVFSGKATGNGNGT
jgi:hypothetical protein